MQLEVKHTIDPVKLDLTGFEAVISKLSEQMESLATNLNSPASSQDTARVNLDAKTKESNQGYYNPQGNAPGQITNPQISSLISKLDVLINRLNQGSNLAPTPEQQAKQVDNQNKSTTIKDDSDVKKPQSSPPSNWAIGAAIAAGGAFAYQSGSFGATAGKASASVNVNGSDYLQFQRDYYNEQASNQQNMANAASVGVGAVGAKMALSGGSWMTKLAGVSLMGASAGINYFTAKSTEENKAQNQLALNADFQNWQLQQMGMSSQSNMSMKAGGQWFGARSGQNFGITDLQKAAYTPKNQDDIVFANQIANTAINMRRDQYNKNTPEDIASYNSGVNKASMMMGVDAQSLNKVVSNYASFTGTGLQDALKKLIDVNTKYGGDTVANTAKMLQLMASTPMSAGTATNLVEKYQYNDAMLNNKVANETTAPMAKFQKQIYMRLAGASDEEIGSGEFNQKHLQQYYSAMKSSNPRTLTDPKWQFMQMAYGASGMSLLAQERGSVNPMTAKNGDAAQNLPLSMQGFRDQLIQALSGITTINANNITINGNANSTMDTTTPTQYDNSHFKPPSSVAEILPKRFRDDVKSLFEHGYTPKTDAERAAAQPGGMMESLRASLRAHGVGVPTGTGEAARKGK